MATSREAWNVSKTPLNTVDIGALLFHCQNVAYAAAKQAREYAAGRQNKQDNKEQNDAHESVNANVVAFAGGLETRIDKFLRSSCAGLKVHISHNDRTQTDPSLAAFAPRAVVELPLHVQVPTHFRSVSTKGTQVFVHVVYDSATLLKGGDVQLDIMIGITIARRSVAGVFCRASVDELPIVAVLDGGVQNMPQGGMPSAANANDSVSVLLSPFAEEGIDAESVLKCVGACTTTEGSNFVQQSLSIARGEAHLCIVGHTDCNFSQAALEAIISASGGHVTDVFGNKFQYDECGGRSGFGFVASSKSFAEARGKTAHVQLCHSWRKAMVFDQLLKDSGLTICGEAQATDIALDTSGRAMTAAWLSRVLDSQVLSFEARECTAVRYLMSNACRLSLRYKNGVEGPRNVFVKRVAMDELEHVRYKMKAAPHKLSRDVCSYKVEAGFLNTAECKRFRTDRTRIVSAHYIESNAAPKGVPEMFSRFLFVLEDFGKEDGWYQNGLLNMDESMAAMDALASFHAFFWNAREMDGYENVKKSVWSQATYWLPSRQASDCFENLAQYWNEHRERFGGVLDDAVAVSNVIDAENFGEMLARYAMGSAEIVHGYGLHEEHGERTLIHGDAKAANMFFRRRAQASRENNVNLEVGLIDLQWCGWGHGSVDVAHVLACAASADVLCDDAAEAVLLHAYHERLVEYLAQFGKTRDGAEGRQVMRFGNVLRVYEEALVDLTRLVVGYHWARIGASGGVLRQRSAHLGSNSYNKNVRCARWLLRRCARVLADKCSRDGAPARRRDDDGARAL